MINNMAEISIVWHNDQDRIFSVKSGDKPAEKFFLCTTKSNQDRWIELLGDLEDYQALVLAIHQDACTRITALDTSKRFIKYIRQSCKFSLHYIDYVDPWIDPHWDGYPYMEFHFVEKEHPDFELYAKEALWLKLLLKAIKGPSK